MSALFCFCFYLSCYNGSKTISTSRFSKITLFKETLLVLADCLCIVVNLVGLGNIRLLLIKRLSFLTYVNKIVHTVKVVFLIVCVTMVKLTLSERIEVLMMVGYGDRQRSHHEVCHLFNTVHPERNPISQSTVSRLVAKFRETGDVKDLPKAGRPKSTTNEDRSLDVLLAVTDNPTTSTTQLGLENDMSSRSVARILKKKTNTSPIRYIFFMNLTKMMLIGECSFVKQ